VPLRVPTLAFLLALGACQAQPEAAVQAAGPSEPFPFLRVGAAPPARPLSATWQAQTAHPVWYIGPLRDTLTVQYPATTAPSPLTLPGTRPAGPTAADSMLLRYAVGPDGTPRSAQWALGDGARMSLTLDTTRRLAAEERFNADLRTDSASQWFAAYPVVLHNWGRDTVLVGTGDYLPLEVEAQDERGRWRVIETPFIYFCGTGLPTLFLPPGQVVVTAVFIPHGPFSTRLRLRYGRTVSASFSGHIHPRQFISQFDSHGEYQAAYLKERHNRAH
jgi:hypothetical protein